MQRQKWKGRRRRRSGRADTNYVARPTPRAAYASPRHWRGDGTLLAGIAGITQCRVYLRCVTRPWKMCVRHADERRRLTQQRQVSHPCSSSLGHDHPSNHQLLRPHSPHTTNFLLPTHQPREGRGSLFDWTVAVILLRIPFQQPPAACATLATTDSRQLIRREA